MAAMKMLLLAVLLGAPLAGAENLLAARGAQPVAVAMDSKEPARPPGYRNAWDDCGGKGASATERMRSIAASIKGFAKEVEFKRSAAQDCGKVDSKGMKPGPAEMVVYPHPNVMQAASQGLMSAEIAKEKFAPGAAFLEKGKQPATAAGDSA